MATYKSEGITDLDRTPAVKRVNRNRVERLFDYYEAAALGNGPHTIKMWRVEAGDRILDGRVFWDALSTGTAGAITVGDSDDTDRFMAAVSVRVASSGNAGTGRFDVVYSPATLTLKADGTLDNVTVEGTGCGYVYTCEKDIVITSEAVTTFTGTIWGWIDVVRAAPTP